MASAQVFVDDAVRGRLPDVCVKTGQPAHGGRLALRRTATGSNGLGAAWVLLFFGPLGWLILLLVAVSRDRGEHLTVTLPYSLAAQQRYHEVRAQRRLVVGVAGVVGVAVLALTIAVGLGGIGVAIGVGALAVAVAALVIGEMRIEQALVGLRLDASRRWVTITGVDPAFVQAYAAQELPA